MARVQEVIIVLNTAAERVETLRRWKKLADDGKRDELRRELDEAYSDAVMERTREDLARAQAVGS